MKGTVLLTIGRHFGNGCSEADAQHLAAGIVSKITKDRAS